MPQRFLLNPFRETGGGDPSRPAPSDLSADETGQSGRGLPTDTGDHKPVRESREELTCRPRGKPGNPAP